MLRKLSKEQKGFTIIEVLIVLAIAGLIMLIVFLAVPALQRNSRNNARNNDAAKVAAAVTECLSNRNGVQASCDSDAEIEQGQTTQLTTVSFGAGGAFSLTDARVSYNLGCAADGASTAAGSGGNSFAVTYLLEPNIQRCIAS
jgi:prepilin-type N-terminal cleavage/methylation domain-containing protein